MLKHWILLRLRIEKNCENSWLTHSTMLLSKLSILYSKLSNLPSKSDSVTGSFLLYVLVFLFQEVLPGTGLASLCCLAAFWFFCLWFSLVLAWLLLKAVLEALQVVVPGLLNVWEHGLGELPPRPHGVTFPSKLDVLRVLSVLFVLYLMSSDPNVTFFLGLGPGFEEGGGALSRGPSSWTCSTEMLESLDVSEFTSRTLKYCFWFSLMCSQLAVGLGCLAKD